MKGHIKAIAVYGLWARATSAIRLDQQRSVTVVKQVDLVVRQANASIPGVQIAAIIPTQSGQIGINPPGDAPKPANIEGHWRYLTEEQGTTKWIGSNPSYIAVKTTTIGNAGSATAVATITKGVSASKNAAGGLDILLSPAVKDKLEAIGKQVKPCDVRRRSFKNQKRQGGPACGLADFVQQVGADSELQGSFAEPLTDVVWNDIDEGYGSGDAASEAGWEGDGGQHTPGEDEGYFSDDGEGFFEGAQDGEGASTLETIVFSSEEEAAAIEAALAGADAAAYAAVLGGSTVTASSFLAWLWGYVKDGKAIPNANMIPKESIHKITKSKTSTEATTTSSGSCPTGSPPTCDKCKPTSVKISDPQVTGLVSWQCSEGKVKDCTCDPEIDPRLSLYNPSFHQAVLEAMEAIGSEPKKPKIECPLPISNAPSEFFLDKTSKSFCEEVMKDLGRERLPVPYDINGNKRRLLKALMATEQQSKQPLRGRAPPEVPDTYLDYTFFLSYEPGDGECLVEKSNLCRNAWDPLVKSNCGSNHGSVGDRMFTEASIDVGCGKFTWYVAKPAEALPAPSLGSRECHDEHSHYPVNGEQQEFWSSTVCKWIAEGKTMKAGDKEIYGHPIGPIAETHQNFKILWKDGCKTNAKEQNAEFPIESDQSVSCAALMRANYLACNNKGAGGYIDAGCLRYDFYATNQ